MTLLLAAFEMQILSNYGRELGKHAQSAISTLGVKLLDGQLLAYGSPHYHISFGLQICTPP